MLGLILCADTGERSISGLSHHKDLAPMGHPPTALSVLHSSHSADKQRYCESTPCDKPPLQDKGQILERDHIRRLSKKQGKKREVEDNFFLRSLSVSFSLSVQLLLCYFWTLFFFSQCDSLLFLLSRFLPLICFSFVFTRAATKNIVFCLGVSPRLPPALRKAIFFLL